jgi:hypothetical protein
MRMPMLALLVRLAVPAFGQDQATLARAFEGRSVTVKLDMPGSSTGVTIHPGTASPLDARALAHDIKSYGIGVHHGESIIVTKVVVKQHHIEFQLGGGGFGTFGDMLAQGLTQAPVVPYEYKSHREKDLETELRYTYDSRDRREIKDEIRREQNERYRDNTMAAAINAQAQAANKADERARRAQGGSRFNVRYDRGVPPSALTPAGLMEALAPYVSFERGGAEGGAAPGASTLEGGSPLRKGMTVVQVEQLLGPAAQVSQRSEGAITISVREYATAAGEQVTASFVGGVLVDYSIGPRP